MSVKALSDYTVYAKYTHYLEHKKRRETWHEAVDRVFDMHARKLDDKLNEPKLKEYFDFAKSMVLKKRVLGAQRALQFGGSFIEKHNEKIYNCATTYVDRQRAFQEIMFLLLCGCGVGFSVQKHHIAKLPHVQRPKKDTVNVIIEDSIEGWADSIGTLLESYFNGSHTVVFDYSKIRPEGSLVSGQFKAPGSKGLERTHKMIVHVLERCLGEKKQTALRPIDAYDIIMHCSDAVLSGGIRRAATLCAFSVDDTDMITAKTGNWYTENPQRGRSNNSAVLVRSETTKEQFHNLMTAVRDSGEPGFIWVEDKEILKNPCVEIGFMPTLFDENGNATESGVQFCNLTEINGKKCQTEQEFFDACKASAIIGTIQAAYTTFPYLGKVSEEIVRREALLGCSITGVQDSPDILLNPEIQKQGAKLIKKINKQVAEMIGINPAARTTCIKPAGSSSLILGTASGIHPHHARRYIRRVQANRLEFPAWMYQQKNPLAVEESVWSASNTDVVISFLCDVPAGAITKNQLSAVDLLERVKLTQQNWVEHGTNTDLCVKPYIRHNVSNTITVQPHEWDEIEKYIYANRKWFAGISLLAASGDKDYPQAPFTTVYTPAEIVKEYGDASVFASGMIVDALRAYNNNLWAACSDVLLNNVAERTEQQVDWIRRAHQFSNRYFAGDYKRMTYCLKDVYNWKLWCDIEREHKPIDWSEVVEDIQQHIGIDTMGAAACAGGACEI